MLPYLNMHSCTYCIYDFITIAIELRDMNVLLSNISPIV